MSEGGGDKGWSGRGGGGGGRGGVGGGGVGGVGCRVGKSREDTIDIIIPGFVITLL